MAKHHTWEYHIWSIEFTHQPEFVMELRKLLEQGWKPMDHRAIHTHLSVKNELVCSGFWMFKRAVWPKFSIEDDIVTLEDINALPDPK